MCRRKVKGTSASRVARLTWGKGPNELSETVNKDASLASLSSYLHTRPRSAKAEDLTVKAKSGSLMEMQNKAKQETQEERD